MSYPVRWIFSSSKPTPTPFRSTYHILPLLFIVITEVLVGVVTHDIEYGDLEKNKKEGSLTLLGDITSWSFPCLI